MKRFKKALKIRVKNVHNSKRTYNLGVPLEAPTHRKPFKLSNYLAGRITDKFMRFKSKEEEKKLLDNSNQIPKDCDNPVCFEKT